MPRGRLVQIKWFLILVLELFFLKTEGLYVDIFYVENAVAKGAVCLYGSAPAYHFDKGFGDGINNKVKNDMQKMRFVQLFFILVLELVFLKTKGSFVDITYLESAVEKGAVCLDGSAPAYHFDKGFGIGINNWLIHVEGGGWCSNVQSCLDRKNSKLGSSKLMSKSWFSGILSNQQNNNPDFYNWNRVKIRYCDGSSFTGDVEAVDPATNLHFRGASVFVAVIEDLLAKGMNHAQNALLSGCSAGGLTSILHCDNFRGLVPKSTKVKCLSDAGYFVNVKDISGAKHVEDYYKDVVNTHGSAKNLPQSCTSTMSPHLCFFPQNVATQIQTPLFILNAAYDSWQIQYILVPKTADPSGSWDNCKKNFASCSPTQLKTLQGFRLDYINALSHLGKSTTRGSFINSCYAHCQTENQETWLTPNSPSLSGISIAKAVGGWFYDRKPFQNIDCPYPCDKTCHNDPLSPNYDLV